nr:MAG TPA: hypothetical protein [Caudoviricetes sp.]
MFGILSQIPVTLAQVTRICSDGFLQLRGCAPLSLSYF